eukprot:1107828-Pelagomonas_calceolata.AAC.4
MGKTNTRQDPCRSERTHKTHSTHGTHRVHASAGCMLNRIFKGRGFSQDRVLKTNKTHSAHRTHRDLHRAGLWRLTGFTGLTGPMQTRKMHSTDAQEQDRTPKAHRMTVLPCPAVLRPCRPARSCIACAVRACDKWAYGLVGMVGAIGSTISKNRRVGMSNITAALTAGDGPCLIAFSMTGEYYHDINGCWSTGIALKG